MAGTVLHQLVIQNTVTHDQGDQAHLDVYHLSKSRTLTDRTAYLLGLPENSSPQYSDTDEECTRAL